MAEIRRSHKTTKDEQNQILWDEHGSIEGNIGPRPELVKSLAELRSGRRS